METLFKGHVVNNSRIRLKSYLQIVLVGLLVLSLAGCNRTNPRQLSDEERLEKAKVEDEAIIVELDSLMSMKVTLPALMDTTVFSDVCIQQFNQLATETNGALKVVANSRFVSETINEIIRENGAHDLDLMIVIDKTGSMNDDISNVKVGLDQILNALKEFDNTRLAVATYGDRAVDGALWFNYQDFGSQLETSREFINKIQITGGGDYPESVFDGVYEAISKDFWRSSSKRIVLLIGDAPSHTGAASNRSIEDVIEVAKANDINMNFYPIILSPYNTEYGTIESMQSLSFIESIYPNPSRGAVVLSFNQIGDLTLELFNEDGQMVQTQPVNSETVRLDLYDQKPGVYVLRVFDAKKNYDVQKIVLVE